MNRLIYFCLVLILLLPATSSAELPSPLEKDLAPVDGTVLMPMGDRYLVDLDTARGVRTGDILAVLTVGERIVDPDTRDVVGTRDSVTGYLQVTEVRSGYSYVTALTPGLSLQQGDRVRRFFEVPAVVDVSVPATLATELKQRLDFLHWHETVPADAATALLWRIQDERLVVATRDGTSLYSYRLGTGRGGAPVVATAPATTEPTATSPRSLLNRGVDTILTTVGFGVDRRLEAPGIGRDQQRDDVWMSPPLGDNPIGLAAADLTGDGQVEVAIAFAHELRIMRLDGGQFTLAAQVDFPAGTELLSIDALDLNKNGAAELYLTAASGENLQSQVVEYRDARFERVITRINWFLRVTEFPGEGPVLLGQRMRSGDDPFRPPVFRIQRQNDELTRGADVNLPDGVNLFSLQFLDAAGDSRRLATISNGDYLQVLTGTGDRLWRSGEHFGGSDTSFYNERDSEKDMPAPVTVQQRLLRLPGGEILAPQNQGSRVLERLRTFNDSQLVAFDWNGSTLQELWRTPLQKGYIADFALADIDADARPELLVAMRFAEKNVLQRGHSALVVYKLQ